jgi:geranylgeranyl diphosphate synthase type I
MKLPEILEKYRNEVNSELREIVDAHPSPLYDMMRYHLGWIDAHGNPVYGDGGKALRPSLCLFSCEAVGGDYHHALPAAAALELVHNFSLIHDDVQDDDRERRHRLTVWAIWGKAQAINAGTAMRILANRALARLGGNGTSPHKQLAINQRLDEISLRLIEGQYLDINYEDRSDISVNDYLTMIGRKTAALISGSMEIGAMMGTDDNRRAGSFREIGRDLGMAFQIQDDILGIWGNQEETGKPAGNDIRRHKKSFPVVYAMEHTGDGVKHELSAIYNNGSMDDATVAKVLDIFEKTGARPEAAKLVEKFCNRAGSAFDGLALSRSAKNDMDEILQFLTRRTY